MEINGYPNYIIYYDGRIYSKKRKIYLKPILINGGYYSVSLSNNGKGDYKLIHRLVAEHFISNPEKLEEVDHIDRDPTNFKSTNLRWVSRLDNQQNKGKPKHNISGLKCISYALSINRWCFSKMINRSAIQIRFKTLTETLCFKFIYIILNKIGRDLNHIQSIHKKITADILSKHKKLCKFKKYATITMKKEISDERHLRYIQDKKQQKNTKSVGVRYSRNYNGYIIDISFTNIIDALCFKFVINLYIKLKYNIENLISNYRNYLKQKKKIDKEILNIYEYEKVKNENKRLKKELLIILSGNSEDYKIEEIKKWFNNNKNNISYAAGLELNEILND
jgi:hypothetical protein